MQTNFNSWMIYLILSYKIDELAGIFVTRRSLSVYDKEEILRNS